MTKRQVIGFAIGCAVGMAWVSTAWIHPFVPFLVVVVALAGMGGASLAGEIRRERKR